VSRPAQPVTQAEFAPLMAAFGPFETKPLLAVGVSGGRDSLALALLANDWARDRGGRILCLIVDHGLRAGSASEATTTAALLAEQEIAVEVLRWAGRKPASGLQEAARAARYRLLFEACRRHGILHLLVGHHADDQAETLAMRAAHDSGPDGLAGMAALVEHREGRLLRPLLSLSRERLTATLVERGISWIDDPSNVDPRFERVRLRQAGFTTAEATTDRATREAQLARLAVEALEFDLPQGVALDRAAFASIGGEAGARLLGRVVQGLARRDYPPKRARLDRAAARLCQAPAPSQPRGKSGKSQDFTLAECRLMLRQLPGERRLRWIVQAENGRKDARKACQPLIPAVFFACGVPATPHLEIQPSSTDQSP
jgi:tRNA(Ile)-lysidine synthase